MIRKLIGIFTCLFLTILFSPAVHAAQPLDIGVTAEGITDTTFLTDNDITNFITIEGPCSLTVTDGSGSMGSLYLMFDLPCGKYTVTDNTGGSEYTAGAYGYLHEYIRLDAPTDGVTIQFPTGASISEIQAYPYGADPQDVQIWQPPLEGETDLMLMSTHGDDEHLFFGGILPMYAGQLGYKVQVVYLTDHRNLTNVRTHEMLNGLWAVGVRNYPVFGDFADFRIDSLEKTYERYEELGTTRDDLMDYVVAQIRRFRPQVIVGHDFAGEYGHGMHMVYTDLLTEAITLTNNEIAYPVSAEAYGTWDVPKTYIHLYEENPIVLDFDTPLAKFNYMSAFDASRYIGFPCHESQVKGTLFGEWAYGKDLEVVSVWDITEYNPCYYGLYRSTVGPDIRKNDFMENTQNSLNTQPPEDIPNETEPPPATTEPTQQQEPPKTAPNNQWLIIICAVTMTAVLIFVLFRRK